DADIAAMRTVKAAFDPDGYLNPAVLFGRRHHTVTPTT
ncbi:FAD-linked oxidase C-terminal domain-containing protein, partial [Mycolicibacterium hippocampi]